MNYRFFPDSRFWTKQSCWVAKIEIFVGRICGPESFRCEDQFDLTVIEALQIHCELAIHFVAVGAAAAYRAWASATFGHPVHRTATTELR